MQNLQNKPEYSTTLFRFIRSVSYIEMPGLRPRDIHWIFRDKMLIDNNGKKYSVCYQIPDDFKIGDKIFLAVYKHQEKWNHEKSEYNVPRWDIVEVAIPHNKYYYEKISEITDMKFYNSKIYDAHNNYSLNQMGKECLTYYTEMYNTKIQKWLGNERAFLIEK